MDCELNTSELKDTELTGIEMETELAEKDAKEMELAEKVLIGWELNCEELAPLIGWELNPEDVCATRYAVWVEDRPLVCNVISTPESTATIPRTAIRCLFVCIGLLYQKSPFLTIPRFRIVTKTSQNYSVMKQLEKYR